MRKRCRLVAAMQPTAVSSPRRAGNRSTRLMISFLKKGEISRSGPPKMVSRGANKRFTVGLFLGRTLTMKYRPRRQFNMSENAIDRFCDATWGSICCRAQRSKAQTAIPPPLAFPSPLTSPPPRCNASRQAILQLRMCTGVMSSALRHSSSLLPLRSSIVSPPTPSSSLSCLSQSFILLPPVQSKGRGCAEGR